MEKNKLVWKNKKWKELSQKEMHDIYALRAQVFVVEQKCVYQDIDNKDSKAIHVYGVSKKKIIAYSRCFKQGDYFNETSFGRAVVVKKERGKGIGDELVKQTIKVMKANWPDQKIKISAQAHLSGFYKKHGFITKGEKYLEDGIPHIGMCSKP